MTNMLIFTQNPTDSISQVYIIFFFLANMTMNCARNIFFGAATNSELMATTTDATKSEILDFTSDNILQTSMVVPEVFGMLLLVFERFVIYFQGAQCLTVSTGQ